MLKVLLFKVVDMIKSIDYKDSDFYKWIIVWFILCFILAVFWLNDIIITAIENIDKINDLNY